MSKTADIKNKLKARGIAADPQTRLDAWERARGALPKTRVKALLRQLHTARKGWGRATR